MLVVRDSHKDSCRKFVGNLLSDHPEALEGGIRGPSRARAAIASVPEAETATVCISQDATIAPGWVKVRNAVVDAVESPRFWGPLAAAALFQVGDEDRKVANWARGHTPLFVSQQNAANWSDRLRTPSSVVYIASVLATPNGSDPKDWLLDKLRGTAVGLVALGVTDDESLLLKNTAARERPNGQDTQSMPSSHTSRSAVLTQLAQRNLEALDLSPTARDVLDVSLDMLTYGTAWARVEKCAADGFTRSSRTLVRDSRCPCGVAALQ